MFLLTRKANAFADTKDKCFCWHERKNLRQQVHGKKCTEREKDKNCQMAKVAKPLRLKVVEKYFIKVLYGVAVFVLQPTGLGKSFIF